MDLVVFGGNTTVPTTVLLMGPHVFVQLVLGQPAGVGHFVGRPRAGHRPQVLYHGSVHRGNVEPAIRDRAKPNRFRFDHREIDRIAMRRSVMANLGIVDVHLPIIDIPDRQSIGDLAGDHI